VPAVHALFSQAWLQLSITIYHNGIFCLEPCNEETMQRRIVKSYAIPCMYEAIVFLKIIILPIIATVYVNSYCDSDIYII